jgi:hypothetical protein
MDNPEKLATWDTQEEDKQIKQGSHTWRKAGITQEFYFMRSLPGNALENQENGKNQDNHIISRSWLLRVPTQLST